MSENKPTWWQVIHSVCAAAFGVQSGENRERDFTKGDPKAYIFVGVVFTVLFVVALIIVVRLVLGMAA